MSLEIWLTFVFTATLILVIPGPTIVYVVGQSLAHGRKASIPLSMGVLLGDAMCITLSLLGLSAVLSVFSSAFALIKYAGSAYLIYLGIKMLKMHSASDARVAAPAPYNSKILFRDVFFVNALNPKGIIFYSAFMPQFVTTQNSIPLQFAVLTLTFLFLALVNVVFYSVLASRTSELFKSEKLAKRFNLTGGFSLIGAGVYSAAIDK